MVVNDTFRTKKPSIGSNYGFYAKPLLLTQNLRMALNLTCATQDIHNKILLHKVRLNIIELHLSMRSTTFGLLVEASLFGLTSWFHIHLFLFI